MYFYPETHRAAKGVPFLSNLPLSDSTLHIESGGADAASHEGVHDGGLGHEVDEEEAVDDGEAHQQLVEVPVGRRAGTEAKLGSYQFNKQEGNGPIYLG